MTKTGLKSWTKEFFCEKDNRKKIACSLLYTPYTLSVSLSITYIHTSTHTHTRTHTCTHTYIHTHIHTHTHFWPAHMPTGNFIWQNRVFIEKNNNEILEGAKFTSWKKIDKFLFKNPTKLFCFLQISSCTWIKGRRLKLLNITSFWKGEKRIKLLFFKALQNSIDQVFSTSLFWNACGLFRLTNKSRKLRGNWNTGARPSLFAGLLFAVLTIRGIVTSICNPRLFPRLFAVFWIELSSKECNNVYTVLPCYPQFSYSRDILRS